MVVEDIDSNNTKYNYKTYINKIKYPINKGDIMGYMEVLLGNKRISKMELISSLDVDKISLIKLIQNNILGVIKGEIKSN